MSEYDSTDALSPAMRDAGRVRDMARERIRSRTEVRSNTSGDGASSESVSLTVDNGHIKLTITQNGDSQTYDFDNADEFKKAEPELYKTYESLLREAGGASRSQVPAVMLAAVG